MNAADVPLKATAVAPVKLAPLMTTLAPTAPLVGVNPVIRGATVKLAALVAVPPGVVTLMGPVVAFAGTVAVICVLLLTVNAAATPLNLTAVAPVNAGPVIVTCVPGAPLVGENVVIPGVTVKFAELIARAGRCRHADLAGGGARGHRGRDLDGRIDGERGRGAVERDGRRPREVRPVDDDAGADRPAGRREAL